MYIDTKKWFEHESKAELKVLEDVDLFNVHHKSIVQKQKQKKKMLGG